MATITLPEFVKLTRDQLIAGVVEDIYTTNPIYNFIPWVGFAGSGVSVNRENALGDAQFLGIGDEITAKNPGSREQVLFRPTTIVGDAEINKLELAMSGSDINDVAAIEISGKAKNIGRMIQQGIATGNGADPNMNSLHSMVDSGQYINPGAANTPLSFELLDALIDQVKSADGYVEWIMMNGREIRALRALYRQLGGVPMMEVQQGNRTIQVVEFNGIPVFQNDYLPITEQENGGDVTGGNMASVYAGVWDDGSKKLGAGMIYPQAIPAGISVEALGAKENYDEELWRVKAYMNFAIFNRKGVARLTSIGGA